MPANLVKFVYAASATPQQIAAFDNNTIYFIGNSHQIYKGSTLYDGGSASVAADLATLESYIGTLPVNSSYTDLIDYIDKSIAAGDTTVTGLVTTLENSLADVATTGTAADVAIADTGGNFTATNVENALVELYTAIGTGGTNSAVTITKTTGGANDSYAYRYVFSQGGSNIANGTIDIAKDMVATSGELIQPTAQNPITINNESVTSGTYIAMTIANGQTFYINVADLIEYNSVSSNAEITLTDINHTISATVGEIAASKIRYSQNQTVAQAINALETASSTGVDTKISTEINKLDADLDATAGSVITGITETDGKITHIDEVALTAANVAYGQTTVGAALDTIGAIPGTSSATTVVGYIDEKVGAGVSTLDADLDASGTPQHSGVFVMSGVTEVDGIITSVDSTEVEVAGAAAAAQAAAQAYTDTALTWGSISS